MTHLLTAPVEPLKLTGETPCPECGRSWAHKKGKERHYLDGRRDLYDVPRCSHARDDHSTDQYVPSKEDDSYYTVAGKATRRGTKSGWLPDERELRHQYLHEFLERKGQRFNHPEISGWLRRNLLPRDLFYQLVRTTCPYGQEEEVYGTYLRSWGFAPHASGSGNFIGVRTNKDGSIPSVCFAAHLDTANSKSELAHINLVWESRSVVGTDGSTLLGGDNRAGVAVLLWMWLHGVPGVYMLYAGEEAGRAGSTAHLRFEEKEPTFFTHRIKQVVCFDRRATGSVITRQMGTSCVSHAYAAALIEQFRTHSAGSDGKTLDFKQDTGGSYTDSATWMYRIAECTNISVGFMAEHGNSETQNLKHLDRLAEVAVKVDWQALPIERDPKTARYSRQSFSYDSFDSFDIYGYGSYRGTSARTGTGAAASASYRKRQRKLLRKIDRAWRRGSYYRSDFGQLVRQYPEFVTDMLVRMVTASPHVKAFDYAFYEVAEEHDIDLGDKSVDDGSGLVSLDGWKIEHGRWTDGEYYVAGGKVFLMERVSEVASVYRPIPRQVLLQRWADGKIDEETFQTLEFLIKYTREKAEEEARLEEERKSNF